MIPIVCSVAVYNQMEANCEYWYHCYCLCLESKFYLMTTRTFYGLNALPLYGDLPGYSSLPPPLFLWDNV